MGGQAVRRSGGRFSRWTTGLLGAALLLTASPPDRLTAQIGYPPDHSPYRDMMIASTVVLTSGYLTGSRGVIGVGPSEAEMYGFRFERPLGRTLGVVFNFANGSASQNVIDPTKDSTHRITPNVRNNLAIVDMGLYMTVTGGKTWRRFAPYLAFTAGAAIASHPQSDVSSYSFGTRFQFGPNAGVRFYPLRRRLSIRADGRWVFWRLAYPLQFKQPGPDGSRVLRIDGSSSEWTSHPWLSLGVGYTF